MGVFFFSKQCRGVARAVAILCCAGPTARVPRAAQDPSQPPGDAASPPWGVGLQRDGLFCLLQGGMFDSMCFLKPFLIFNFSCPIRVQLPLSAKTPFCLFIVES